MALAMLLPALFLGPLAALRRRWVVFNVLALAAGLYAVRFTFVGFRRTLERTGAWWTTPLAFWLALSLVAAAGLAWTLRRKPAGAPVRGEAVALGLLSLGGLAAAAYPIWDGGPPLYPLLVPCAACAAGMLRAALPGRAGSPRPRGLTAQAVVLGTLSLGFALFGIAAALLGWAP
jgi:hypothetical protein